MAFRIDRGLKGREKALANLSMPQSLFQIYVHLVFSTKDREPWLTGEVQERLLPYLAGALNRQDSSAIKSGWALRSRAFVLPPLQEQDSEQGNRRYQGRELEVDEGRVRECEGVRVAGRIWVVFGERVADRAGYGVYREAGGASSEDDVPGGVSQVVGAVWGGI